MPSHGVTADAAFSAYREVIVDQGRQFFGNVIEHAVIGRPGFLGGVNIEAGAGAEIVLVVLARKLGAARTGVRAHDGDAELGCNPLCA